MDAELAPVLALYPSSIQPIGPTEFLGNAGGGSGVRLWKFATTQGPLVARAWPPEHPDRPTLAQIHSWLVRAAPLEFIPVPLAGLDGRTIQGRGGRLWELAPWLPGRADPSRPPDPWRLHQAFAGLAAFHRIFDPPEQIGPSPGLRARFAEIDGLLGGEFDRFRDAITRGPEGEERDLATCWLAAARDRAGPIRTLLEPWVDRAVPLGPRLRDARPDHFLFDGDRLAGLVDFGAMGLESASADLARLMSEWLGDDLELRALAQSTYQSVRPLAPVEDAAIDTFTRSANLLGGARWVRWGFVEAHRFDNPLALAEGLRRSVMRIEVEFNRSRKS